MRSVIRNYRDGVLPGRKTFTLDVAEERNLVSGLRARDPDAMEELYDRFGSLLYTIILRRVTDRHIAEDILQEVFLRIWNRISLFNEAQGTLMVWTITIARNGAIDYLRAGHKAWPSRKQVDISDYRDRGDLASLISEEAAVHSRMEIQRALSCLNPSQRQVVELAFEGFSQAEIASRLKKPLGTIKSIVRVALKLLRANLSPATVGC